MVEASKGKEKYWNGSCKNRAEAHQLGTLLYNLSLNVIF